MRRANPFSGTPSVERTQLELFRSVPGDLAPRDAQDLMAWPFFSLAKTRRTVPIEFRMGATWISVEAVAEHGMATIWDADVLIWAASQLIEARDAGRPTSRLMVTTPHEILAFTQRGTGKASYERLKAALDRLQSTTVATSIRQEHLRARYRLGSDPFDVRDNIMAGAAYLREMFDRYGNVTAMLAAYNAGPGRYDEHLSRGRPLPAETHAYLVKLAAITSGSDATQLATAPAPDPLAWRRAALFAVRSDAASTVPVDAANDVTDARPERAPSDRTDVAIAAIIPPSTGLFVPLSGRSPP